MIEIKSQKKPVVSEPMFAVEVTLQAVVPGTNFTYTNDNGDYVTPTTEAEVGEAIRYMQEAEAYTHAHQAVLDFLNFDDSVVTVCEIKSR